jgi:glycosyltransferase involved in cell wall biosynthesis
MSTIDVCIASFNGGKYIQEQLVSILGQTEKVTKVIVCDDVSTDNTVLIVSKMVESNPAVQLIKNRKNLGHVKNFEKCLSLCSADFVFLADQDDVWDKDKVSEMVGVFKAHPNVVLAHHDLLYVDEELHALKRIGRVRKHGLQSSPLFLLRQLLRPEVYGCGVAIRGSLLKKLLPFPGIVYAHDHWLATVAPLYGKVFLLDRKLVRYRQHHDNLTPKKSISIFKKIKLRVLFLLCTAIALFRKLTISC